MSTGRTKHEERREAEGGVDVGRAEVFERVTVVSSP